ncbi:MAG: tRNA-dihydrouridine synthase family protein [Bacteroidaceae bacterium]|nr:tRNA-dihydrouridine synthase family protein [Bacteroidaceae bacterium]
MKIGTIDLGPRPLLLAPMEDVTDIGFRLLCRKLGAAMVYSEFVAADALVRMVNKSLQKLTVCDEERPVAIQIYGKDPAACAEAAQIVVERAHPDVLDINFGCPVKRVAGKGAGAGLLQDVPRMLDIARSVVQAVNVPVTAKTRLGWDGSHIIIEELAEQLQDCGIQALTIHGRTRAQMYTGSADWNPIAAVKRNPRVKIPIIGNGDLCTAEDARRAFDEFGVDATMVGRATFGRPWVFKEMRDALQSEPHDVSGVIDSRCEPMSAGWKLDVLKEQVRQSVARIDEYRGILHIRRHLAASPIFKGIPDFRQTRIAMLRAETVDELFSIMESTRPMIGA